MQKQKGKKEFQERFDRHAEELRGLYLELYHGDGQAWEYFCGMLFRCFQERPEALKKMDRARERDAEWYRGLHLLGTLMYADAFAGTLQGVREKLDYLTECGINYLHLMPLLMGPAGRSDGG